MGPKILCSGLFRRAELWLYYNEVLNKCISSIMVWMPFFFNRRLSCGYSRILNDDQARN